MSADSPNKSNHHRGHSVSPQPVNDRSIIENVAGFINEVVPQGYSSAAPSEGKEAIQWARFECGDINDPALYPESSEDHISAPPLLLVLGYSNGVQVWTVPASGEASEVLSSRQGVVRTLRVLPSPRAAAPDAFSLKRPLVALCDSAGPGPQFCSVSFVSLRSGEQVRCVKLKSAVSDVLASRRVVLLAQAERISVLHAGTLDDCLTVTTCYPCPGPGPSPVALGERWLAYAERRLVSARRSSGGSEGDGVQSYTAAVLHAARSLGRGLRELGETVAGSLTGAAAQRGAGPSSTPGTDASRPGVVTILDTQVPGGEAVAHFTAHSDAVVALAFDPSGLLLLTADRRGHCFHLFRVQPHPAGAASAAVHHLYILHRGDTGAKVQGMAFSADSRWVAVSTMRGTTHVFPITPYGGAVGVRTHGSPHVVNRLSRFHRSAGLTTDGRNSPVPLAGAEAPAPGPAVPHPNPRLPPYPHPTVLTPLAQLRQPFAPSSPGPAGHPSVRALGRAQSWDEGPAGGGTPLRVAACFAPPRAWLAASPTAAREPAKACRRLVDSLFVMTCHGTLIQYDLRPRHAAGVAKEKVCDDTPLDLEVEAKAQWQLLRSRHWAELQPPLPASSPLVAVPERLPPPSDPGEERWLSQVEIVTHAGPHRRLWMGPQFSFKTYASSTSAVPLESDALDVGVGGGSRPARSNPVNMPAGSSGPRPAVPVLIESGSASSYEQSPTLLEAFGPDGDSDGSLGPGESQLKEDLADAMLESPGLQSGDAGRRAVFILRGDQPTKQSWSPVEKVVNPVGTAVTVSLHADSGEERSAAVIGDSSPHGVVRAAARQGGTARPRASVSAEAAAVAGRDDGQRTGKDSALREAVSGQTCRAFRELQQVRENTDETGSRMADTPALREDVSKEATTTNKSKKNKRANEKIKPKKICPEKQSGNDLVTLKYLDDCSNESCEQDVIGSEKRESVESRQTEDVAFGWRKTWDCKTGAGLPGGSDVPQAGHADSTVAAAGSSPVCSGFLHIREGGCEVAATRLPSAGMYLGERTETLGDGETGEAVGPGTDTNHGSRSASGQVLQSVRNVESRTPVSSKDDHNTTLATAAKEKDEDMCLSGVPNPSSQFSKKIQKSKKKK
ncbi:breast carcinoma-amplified sequence 3 homolog isoform X2 [Bacillus rossius redtenbacheri]